MQSIKARTAGMIEWIRLNVVLSLAWWLGDGVSPRMRRLVKRMAPPPLPLWTAQDRRGPDGMPLG